MRGVTRSLRRAPIWPAGNLGTFAAPIQVVDSLGATHSLTVTFTKTDSNAWSYEVTAPGADLASGKSGKIRSPDPGGRLSWRNAQPHRDIHQDGLECVELRGHCAGRRSGQREIWEDSQPRSRWSTLLAQRTASP